MLAAEFCVDSSVLVAIFNEESDAERLEDICWNFNWAIGWPTIFETRLWLIRNRPPGSGRLLDAMIDQASITQIEFGGGLEGLAAEAFDRFGKGRHPAKLNFGDCMAYACAKSLNLPLLFKGGDFGKTDIAIHPASVIIE